MALVTVSEGGGGDFLPIVKYDARAGRFFRVDKADGVSNAVDITRSFKAIFDLEQVEVGFIHFPVGAAPNFCLVRFGQPAPVKPSAEFKPGIRMNIKLSKECGGDIRELAQTAGAFLRGINLLHDEYIKLAAANAGNLPVVVMNESVPIATKTQKGTTTNYQPVFNIVGWAPRPADMPLVTKAAGNGAARPAATNHAASNDEMVAGTTVKPTQATAAVSDDFG